MCLKIRKSGYLYKTLKIKLQTQCTVLSLSRLKYLYSEGKKENNMLKRKGKTGLKQLIDVSEVSSTIKFLNLFILLLVKSMSKMKL